jgi:hypothetical protein
MADGHGGARKGAGRKPGSANVRTRQIADRAAAEGATPLEVMLQDMREKLAVGDVAGAADRARDCAPYVHPRLSSSNVAVRRVTSIAELTDAELAAIAGEFEGEGGVGETSPRQGKPH